jgi:hypothetical protein
MRPAARRDFLHAARRDHRRQASPRARLTSAPAGAT